MFKIRNDLKGWHLAPEHSDQSAQTSCSSPLTIHFADGVSVQTCPSNPGTLVDVAVLEEKAQKLFHASSSMAI